MAITAWHKGEPLRDPALRSPWILACKYVPTTYAPITPCEALAVAGASFFLLASQSSDCIREEKERLGSGFHVTSVRKIGHGYDVTYIRLIQCVGNGECGNRREKNALRYERAEDARPGRGHCTGRLLLLLQSCQAREDMMDYSWNQESDSEST